jgi:hypothetical protein
MSSHADTERRVVHFEDTGKEREVKRACKTCGADIDEPMIVSRLGVAHESSGYGMTVCGQDATGDSWWWRT